jgi:hypothetical protein
MATESGSTPEIPNVNRAINSIGNDEDRKLLTNMLARAGLINVQIIGIQLGEFQCKLALEVQNSW